MSSFVFGPVCGALVVFEAVVGGGFLYAIFLFLAYVAGQFLQGELLHPLHVLLHYERIVFVAAFAETE
jgi:hypothetical protein